MGSPDGIINAVKMSPPKEGIVICRILIAAVAVVLATTSWPVGLQAQTVREVLQQMLKQAADNAASNARQQCAQQEGAAQVSVPDESVRPSFVLQSADGRLFQVRNLAVSSASASGRERIPYDVGTLLGVASTVSFNRIDNSATGHYWISFSPRAADPGSSTAEALAAMAISATLQTQVRKNPYVTVLELSGQTLGGDPWRSCFLFGFGSELSLITVLQ